MRRVLRLIAALGLLLAGLMISQSSAVAAPAGAHALAPSTCPKPAPYPPSPGATVKSSTTTPFVGQTIEVSGVNYCPDEDVQLYIGSHHVGTAHTDNKGSFDPQAVVPGPAGKATLLGRGASGLKLDSDSLTLTIRAGGSGTPASPGSGGGLAVTGTQLAGLIVLAVILLGGGGAMIVAGRRKRSVHS